MLGFMNRNKKWYSLVLVVMMLATMVLPSGLVQKAKAATETVAGWTFSATNISKASSGTTENQNNAVLILSNNRTPTYSTTSNTIYKDGWASPTRGYWEAKFSTLGYSGLSLSSKQYGTNGGPKDFQLEYSLNGTNFVSFSTVYQLATSITQKDVSLPSEVDNQPVVYIRWVNTSNSSISATNVGSNGTGTITQSNGNSRIADIIITGTPLNPGQSTAVTGVTLNNTAPSMTVGGSVYGLIANVSPSDATNKMVTWSSSNAAVASVNSSGVVTPLTEGTAVITATTADGGFTATSTVTVAPAPVQTKTANPVASKLTFPSLTSVTGSAGAVAGSVLVSVYADSNKTTQIGSGTSAADGSFNLTLSNLQSQTTIYVTAQENGKDSSDPVAVTFMATQVINPGDVVLSQLYVNGGNSGAFYKTKFIELYNNTDKDINLNGWSIAYTSAATMSFGAGKPLSGTIKAHGYFLITFQTGTAGKDLPIATDLDVAGLTTSGSTGGAIVLAKKTTAVTGVTDPDVVDLLAYTNAATTVFKNPLYWGQPFVATNVGSGTILRLTNAGSDPRGAIGFNNGWFTKDPSKDFVVNTPASTSNPAEVIIRNSNYMLSPDASKITFTTSGATSTVVGTAGAVPASSTVKAYLESNGTVSNTVQAKSAADGSFTLSFPVSGSSVYLTHTDTQESKYTRIDVTGYTSTVTTIDQLRKNDTNGLPLNIGYSAMIEGVVSSSNKALGPEKTNFYIQDATGGINVIGGTDPSVPIQLGHKMRITGKLAFTAGTTQFIPASMLDEGGNTLPSTTPMTLNSWNAYANTEPMEGKLVSFKGKVTNIPASGPDYNVTVTDDSDNTAIVSILSTTGIDVAGGAVTLGETYTFTGIVKQSKQASPYTSGYALLPRKAGDIQGELQLMHTPLQKAYIGVDTNFKATAKFADSVTIWYKGQSDMTYTSVAMVSADKLNYNGKIATASMPAGKLLYYIEAINGGNVKNVGSVVEPITIDVVEDKDGPAYADFLPLEGDEIETKHPAISASMEDANGVDQTSVKIWIDGVNDFTAKAAITETRVKLTLTPSDDLSTGEHSVTISGKDKLGNESTRTWKFKVAERFTGGNHYYGTTHNHTDISHDATGTPEDALKAAMAHDYDFFAFSDHSHDIDASQVGSDTVDHNGMPERTGGSDWALTKSLAKNYTKDGSFVVFPAFEMTSTTWGHSNVFGTSNFIDRVESGGKYQNLQNYYAWVLTYDNIVAQFNHPAMSANAFDNFIPYDKNVDRLFTMLEVGNGSGKYSYANAQEKLFSALDLGWHVAPTYGEDNHDATWGQTKKRTVIVANDLSQDSLMEAMRKMRVYFTEDSNAKLDVSASGWYMGSTTDTKNLQFNIVGSDSVLEQQTDPKYSYLKTISDDNIAKVELLTNGGRVIDSYTPTENQTSFTWTPTVNVIGGQQWFITRVTQKDGDRIYSSPIWSPVEPVSVKVSDVTAVDGAIVGGYNAALKAGISNMGTVDITNMTAHFYYDQVDSGHLIGDAQISSLKVNQSTTASIVWNNPPTGNHTVIVIMNSVDQDLGDNRFEQVFTVKAPLGKTILIDASKQNENTTKDAGTYKDNLKLFTTMMRQQGYTVAENAVTITDDVLKNVSVMYISHPASAYSSAEIAAISKFVGQGGSLYLAEKSNYGGSNQNLNAILSGAGSSLMVNNDGVFDETTDGNFWGTPLNSNFSVRVHPKPVSNNLTDFVSTIEYYSGSSLAKNDGTGNKVALTNTDSITILVRGNESTFQDSTQIKADTATYNVHTPNGKSGPALTDVTGGSAIPLVASEVVGNGRIVVSGMNIFNDKQMDQTYNPKGNDPVALNVVNWLSHLEPKVTNIADARKLPEGTQVLIQGKVTTAAGVFFDAAYVQDDTGGIMAFNEVPVGTLKFGDVIRVYGHIKIFENNTEIEFDKFTNSIVQVSSGTPIEPKIVNTKDSVSDTYQGQLVKVTGKVTARPDDTTYLIDDGSGEVMVFVDGFIINQSGPIPQLKVGDTLEAVGLSGKYAMGDRIRVRDTKELKQIVGVQVPVTGVTLNKSTLSLTVGSSETLTATVAPDTATNKAVKWSTSDSKVATVVDGVVTAMKAGKATITVKTTDGNFEASTVVTVTAASDPDTNGGRGDTSSSSTNIEPTGTVKVTIDQLKTQESGKATVVIKPDTTEVKLPSNTSELLANNKLEIKSDKLKLELPTDLLKQLENKFTTEELKDSTISLKMNPLSVTAAEAIITQSKISSNAGIKLAGDVYEFSLSITSADGKTEYLAKFNQPITIRLKVDPNINKKEAGIFYISDRGDLEYIGGEYKDGEMVAQISHFSKYAVLEVKKAFNDLPVSHWAHNVITELTSKQILSGTSQTTFEPSRSITRAEFTAMLVKAWKLNESDKVVFSDVSANAWYAKAVASAYTAGIISGKTSNQFDPNGLITREEMVTMMMRSYEVHTGKKLEAISDSSFKDMDSVSSWAASSVQAAAKLGFIQGRALGQFDPSGITSRAEAAQVIYNLLYHS
ncbi:S-layer homology domain-containing protein [Paenibacillus alginolyticus]|uniref:S-layer homology domain-containing protein n=1 Tax=Paenibacillus alginolyticus TaxID=59839 RepID=UPI000684E719|nr:S-layer homology domain-containing protein [Paenibacillus alginolyticus]MCY9666928.1 S-layer homology domain-containing protein [Paenibacillus alginolyticus]